MHNLKKVLDHGLVRLVSYTQPASSCDSPDWTGDLEVVRNARVSYNAEMRTGEDAGKDEKLINYLHKNRHTSPLEALVFTFEVKAPIFVLRQWHRHRTWSYNEVSARYSELPSEYYVPAPEHITTQSTSNKQMRTTELHPESEHISAAIDTFCSLAHKEYQRLLRMGCPRELARGVLPLNTYSHMFATVDLHNLFHFLTLRLHEHAQYEIRVYAEAMLALIESVAPLNVAAYKAAVEKSDIHKS